MKKYAVTKIKDHMSFDEAFNSLDSVPYFKINEVNWSAYPYKPNVNGKLAWNTKGLFLEFQVEENQLKAEQVAFMGPVHRDSCVEFFVSIDNKHYYNFEFNAIGARYVNFRSIETREKKPFSKKVLEQIQVKSSEKLFTKVDRKKAKWKLNVWIPFSFFIEKNIPQKIIKANFYKCGDGLEIPHYLSWNAIQTKKPSFHEPDFFGELSFEK
ncbi:hypothetical protein UJ101_01405 [Flavobacteriaceae bacterium UJ101]|nr:hypothetical protein UJ101_01405 [Flavobacteriaceae bacterium UJ101]